MVLRFLCYFTIVLAKNWLWLAHASRLRCLAQLASESCSCTWGTAAWFWWESWLYLPFPQVTRATCSSCIPSCPSTDALFYLCQTQWSVWVSWSAHWFLSISYLSYVWSYWSCLHWWTCSKNTQSVPIFLLLFCPWDRDSNPWRCVLGRNSWRYQRRYRLWMRCLTGIRWI